MFIKWLKKLKRKKICKANRYFCPDCIYHEHIFEGTVFRGTRCRLEDNHIYCTVTHWMSLPELPEEGGVEDAASR